VHGDALFDVLIAQVMRFDKAFTNCALPHGKIRDHTGTPPWLQGATVARSQIVTNFLRSRLKKLVCFSLSP
jgi:hypothetical protein